MKMQITLTLTWFFIAIMTMTSSTSGQDQQKRTPKIIGYLPSYRVSDKVLDQLDNYTDIVYFGAEIGEDGSIEMSDSTLSGLKKVAREYHNGGFKFHFCLGGWEKDKHFPAVTANATKRKRFIKELVSLQKKYKFEGVDYDWEYPRTELEFKNFALLIEETQAAFPESFEVTAAINPLHKARPVLWEHLDRIHFMCYDLGIEHCSIEHSKKAIQKWRKLGVSDDKITIGAAFYGRLMRDRNNVKTYAQIIGTYGAAAAKENKMGGYFYDNKTTLQQKLDLMKKENISGMIIWEVGQDTSDEHSLGAFIKDNN